MCSVITLKTKIFHDANFVIIGGTRGCHHDKLWCHQWWQSWHHDDYLCSNVIYTTHTTHQWQWWSLFHKICTAQIAKFMGQTWGPPGSCRPHVGPLLTPWTLLSWRFLGFCCTLLCCVYIIISYWIYIIYLTFLHDRPWIPPWIKLISSELGMTIHVIASQLFRYCDVISNQL